MDYLDDDAPRLLEAYFGVANGAPDYSGSWFERVGADGNDPTRVTAADLVAVTMLSVEVPARAAIQILGPLADPLRTLLTEIPSDRDLWACDAADVAPGSLAAQLWHAFEKLDGIGWVTAGKLCARKRPRMLPVYDNVVKKALALPAGESFWSTLHETLTTRPEVVARLDEIRSVSPGVPHDLPLLRVLDIAIWMQEHGKSWLPTGP